jgi:hypothetical protein
MMLRRIFFIAAFALTFSAAHAQLRGHGGPVRALLMHAARDKDGLDVRHIHIGNTSITLLIVCAALAFEPKAFGLGIDIFGVTNWPRTLASIPPWWSDMRDSLYAEIGDPVADKLLAGTAPVLPDSLLGDLVRWRTRLVTPVLAPNPLRPRDSPRTD